MNVTIELERMEFRAPHGCYDLEKVVGNRFEVDVMLIVEIGDAAKDDELLKSVNYLTVYDLVAEQMQRPSDTIENVAWRIQECLYGAFNQIVGSKIKVSKLAPPLGGKVKKVSVTLTK
ncbi:MAG: dihydroneopterin aldolase [Tidjanibacter sp.]|nr:dihydroneopterin aldolase [Tidjanibacter sp.]MBR3931774.1 dihydroneopterin aldolase [Tidjanibacter sp.]